MFQNCASAQDNDGESYLDFTAGIAVNCLGHSDPGWAETVAKQAGRLCHTSNLYLQLSSTQGPSQCFFSVGFRCLTWACCLTVLSSPCVECQLNRLNSSRNVFQQSRPRNEEQIRLGQRLVELSFADKAHWMIWMCKSTSHKTHMYNRYVRQLCGSV